MINTPSTSADLVAQQLVDTDLTITEICSTLSIDDTPLLKQEFKTKYGTTYEVYRNHLRLWFKPRTAENLAKPKEKFPWRGTDTSDDDLARHLSTVVSHLETSDISVQAMFKQFPFSNSLRLRMAFKTKYGTTYAAYRKQRRPEFNLTKTTVSDGLAETNRLLKQILEQLKANSPHSL